MVFLLFPLKAYLIFLTNYVVENQLFSVLIEHDRLNACKSVPKSHYLLIKFLSNSIQVLTNFYLNKRMLKSDRKDVGF